MSPSCQPHRLGNRGVCPDLQTHSSNGQAETLSPETGRHSAHWTLGLQREALTELGQRESHHCFPALACMLPPPATEW